MAKFETKVDRYYSDSAGNTLYQMEFECSKGWEPISLVFLKNMSTPPDENGYVYEAGEYTVVYKREVKDE